METSVKSNRTVSAHEAFKGESITVSTHDIRHEDHHHKNERTVSMADDHMSDSSTIIHKTSSSIEIVQTVEVARKTKKRIIHDLGDVTEDDLKLIDLRYYLDFIGDERLIHMPVRGSDWDRVLTAAEYFGVQMHEFTLHVSDFIQHHEFICDTALAGCYLLLQVSIMSHVSSRVSCLVKF